MIQADGHRVDGKVAAVLIVLQRTVFHNGLARIVAVALFAGAYEFHFYFLTAAFCPLSSDLYLCCTEIAEHAEVCPASKPLLQGGSHLDAAAYYHDVNVVAGAFEENVADVASYHIALQPQLVGHGGYLVEDVLVQYLG